MMKYIKKYSLFLFSAVIINIFLFDGIYLNKSYVALNYERALVGSDQEKSNGLSFLNLQKKTSGESWIDIGGSAYQTNLIPEIVIKSKSILWTNFLATGNNILYDLTFQPLSTVNLLALLFGGSLKILNLVFISFIWISLYFLMLTLRRFFQLDLISCTFGGIIFVGNGFITSGWSNHVTLPYIFCPIYLYFLSEYLFRNRFKLICPLIGAFMLLNTFMPTLILMLVAIFIICLQLNSNLGVYNYKNLLVKLSIVNFQCLLLVAFVYIPAFLISRGSGSVDSYLLNHPYYYLPAKGLFLLITPHLFLNNFNSLYKEAFDWYGVGEFAVTYIGLIPLYFVLSSFLIISKRNIFLVLGLIFFILRIFTPFLEIIFNLPVLQSISVTYYFSIISILSVFLAAINFNELKIRFSGKEIYSYIMLLLIVAIYFMIVWVDLKSKINSLIFAMLLILILGVLINSNFKGKHYVVIFFAALELFLSQNFNKENVKNLNDYIYPASIREFIKNYNGNYRFLNTTLNGIPPEVDAALGINGLHSFGHLSIDHKYLKKYINGVGSDSVDYPIEGMTGCNNIKINEEIYNNLSIKYILTDNGVCKEKFKTKFNALYEDSYFTIFNNPNAKPISFVSGDKNNLCKFELIPHNFYQKVNFSNCIDSVYYTNINYGKYFSFYTDNNFIEPKIIDDYIQLNIINDKPIYIIYSFIPAYIGFFVSFLTLLFLMMAKIKIQH
jgi:hypothetical protein